MRVRKRWATPRNIAVRGFLLRNTEADIATKVLQFTPA
jgi:hypothetical protein